MWQNPFDKTFGKTIAKSAAELLDVQPWYSAFLIFNIRIQCMRSILYNPWWWASKIRKIQRCKIKSHRFPIIIIEIFVLLFYPPPLKINMEHNFPEVLFRSLSFLFMGWFVGEPAVKIFQGCNPSINHPCPSNRSLRSQSRQRTMELVGCARASRLRAVLESLHLSPGFASAAAVGVKLPKCKLWMDDFHLIFPWKIPFRISIGKTLKKTTLPETNSSPLKINGWQTILSFWAHHLFRCKLVYNPQESHPRTQ